MFFSSCRGILELQWGIQASSCVGPGKSNHPFELRVKGDPGSLIDLKSGCRFYARCRYATDECKDKDPDNVILAPGHQVACVHPLNIE